MKNEENNIYNKVKQEYYLNLVSLRPDLTKMIYDSYLAFDYEELETKLNNNLTDANNLSPRKKSDYENSKGVFKNKNQFFKGFEQDIFDEEINKVNNKINEYNTKNSITTKKLSNSNRNMEIKQFVFLRQEEIPKNPRLNQWSNQTISEDGKTESRETNLIFKKKTNKILSFAKSSNIRKDVLEKWTNDIFMNAGNDKIIKIVDKSKDNKILFLDRIMHRKTNNGELIINDELEKLSLEQRAEALATSRFYFIEKIAIIVGKFIVAIKKLYKRKKEKEKMQALQDNNTIKHFNQKRKEKNKTNSLLDSYGSTSLLNGKSFRTVREYTTSQNLKELIDGLKVKSSKISKEDGLKVFKHFLANKISEKEEVKNNDKLKDIRDKVKSLIVKHKENDELIYSGKELVQYLPKHTTDNHLEFDEYNRALLEDQNWQDDNIHHYESGHPKYISNQNYIISNTNQDKIVAPKKLIDVKGLKFFIKEEMKKNKFV